MEDPATWGEAERVVQTAIRKHQKATAWGVYGLSLTRCICDALRESGLLAPDPRYSTDQVREGLCQLLLDVEDEVQPVDPDLLEESKKLFKKHIYE